ncbi:MULTISPECIES: beta-galactosidase [Caproicibacterium]|uniref:beta-galactosidase n=1 Tax=Caproicibacterium argilliputei TaxID=3030016 RepID=A0AA97D9D8_9FIRM|nr:beta-galactosidase [Caproicibacterium argilliputei]WOC31724.1 beta-galactosidase [Caproicibacterium argilliputei]
MKNRQLLFGAAYYPEYLPYDREEQDFQMMRRAGMNVIRIAESTWSTLEPQDGRFCFSLLDRTLQRAQQAGLQVILGTPTYAIPPWLAKKHPEFLVVTEKGQAHYGHRQLMDLANPDFRFYAERVIRALLAHAAKHPAVIGFQLDNETKHYHTASVWVQRLFRSYLMQKFHTPQQLNRAFGLAYWSNAIEDWNDFPDMRGCVNAGLACEFDRFRRSLAADYLKWQAELVNAYKRPAQFIVHNFDFEWKTFGTPPAPDGYSYGVQPDINHLEASAALTVCGADIYHPTQDKLTGAEIAFCGDSTRCLKQKNYLVCETQAQAFPAWTPYPGQLRLQAYSHLATGANGMLYWHWGTTYNGVETYWRGLLGQDYAENPPYREACVIGREWEHLGDKLYGLQKNNRIALVVDTLSLHALRWFPTGKELSYNDVVRWMYDALYTENMECDVVDIHGLDFSRYHMLVVPALYCASEETLEKLDQFVNAGGVLVSSFRSFVADEQLSVWADTPPHRLARCFGMHYCQYTLPHNVTLQGEPVLDWMELLVPDSAETVAQYTHPVWGAYAGITRAKYGTGTAYYIGCHTTEKLLKSVFAQAAEDAGLTAEIPQTSFPVILRSGSTAGGERWHYLLHYSRQSRQWCCAYPRVKDLLTNQVFCRGETVPLAAWDVRILQDVPEQNS